MVIGFYHAGAASPYAAAMVTSARRVMSGVDVVQFSPEGTASVPGVREVRETETEPLLARAVLLAYASVTGDWLFLDTDVLVQRDVQHVFDRPFDVAVATRLGTFRDENEAVSGFMARMPINKGVVFSRSQDFWRATVAHIETFKDGRQAWMGDQQAVCDVIATNMFHVEHIENTYNYPPKRRDEDLRDKALVHFKGSRKPWMLERRAA